MVMASTTWATIADDPPFIFCTRSPMPGTPHLRDSGSRAAFDQVLLVCGQVETGMILQELTQILIVWRGHGSLSDGKQNKFQTGL